MNIVFDIGGTNMRVAAAHNGELGEIKKVPTPQDPKEGITTFVALAKELSGGTIEAAAGDIAGRIDSDGKVAGARNLKPWIGTDLISAFKDGLGAPVKIVNDCESIGLAEAMQGAGKGSNVVVYITVSTGVGGARIDAGKIDYDANTAYIIPRVQVQGSDIENLVSGTAVEKKFGIHPRDLDSIDERNKLADLLAEGLSAIYTVWKPDVFVLGGSMIIGVNPIPLERVREKFSTIPVKMAELGDNGGLIGGMILAEQK